MAQSDNLFNFRGKIGDLIFYSRNGKTFVKKNAGGFVNGKSNDHPHTKAVQKNFSEIASFVKHFKEVLLPIMSKQKDGTFHNQLVALFCKIKKMAPDQNLYMAFKEKSALQLLQRTSINKNSVLKGIDCEFNPSTNALKLNPYLIQICREKYPNGFLEIHTAWLCLRPTLAMELKAVGTNYISLKEEMEQLASRTFIYDQIDVVEDELQFPIVSLQVVQQPSPFASPYHLYRYSLLTLV